MKKYLKILILCLTVGILTTGCMEANIKMGINDDKSMDFNMSASIDLKQMQSLMDSMGQTDEMTDEEYFDCLDLNDGDASKCTTSNNEFNMDDINDSIDEEQLKELENLGFTVTHNSSNGKYEVTITKKYDNIENLSKNEVFTLNMEDITNKDFDNKFFKIKKGLLEDTYEFHLKINDQDTSTNTSDLDVDLDSIKSFVNMNYELTLPNESISNNATSISSDKKTLTWDLLKTGNSTIDVTFALPNSNKNLIIYGGIGLGCLIIIIILILIIKKIRKNKKKKLEQTVPVTPITPSTNETAQNVQPLNSNVQPIEQMSSQQPLNTNGVAPVSLEPTEPVSREVPLNGEGVAPISLEQTKPVSNEMPLNGDGIAPVNIQPIEPVNNQVPLNGEGVAPVNVQPTEPVVNQDSIPLETVQSEVLNQDSTQNINETLQDVAMDILNKNNSK